RLPAGLRQLLDEELAAGNSVIDLQRGHGQELGRVTLVLEHPLRGSGCAIPRGVHYQQIKGQDPLMCRFYSPDEQFSVMMPVFQRAAPRRPTAEPQPPPATPQGGDAASRFLSSMVMTFDMWHDGIGYDLDALAEVQPSSLAAIETALINHKPRDWRDIEA